MQGELMQRLLLVAAALALSPILALAQGADSQKAYEAEMARKRAAEADRVYDRALQNMGGNEAPTFVDPWRSIRPAETPAADKGKKRP
jgi:hypothetical protein